MKTELPNNVDLEISRACNLRCVICTRNKTPKGIVHFTPELFGKVLDNIPTLEWINLLGGGEPLCNPYLDTILGLAQSKGVKIRLITNGTLITSEVVHRWVELGVWKVAVSLDSLKQSLMDKLRSGASVEKIKESIRLLTTNGIDTKIDVVLYRSNLYELMDIAKFCKDVGVSKLYIITPVFEEDGEDNPIWGRPLFMDEDRNYIRGVKEWLVKNGIKTSGTPYYMPTFLESCGNSSYVTVEGDVYTCPISVFQGAGKGTIKQFYYGHKVEVPLSNFYMGSLLDSSFSQIWNNSQYKDFRRNLKGTARPEETTLPIGEFNWLRNNLDGRRFSLCEVCVVRWRQGCDE